MLIYIFFTVQETTEVVNFSGDEIEYIADTNVVILRNFAEVKYGDIVVRSDSIYYDVERKLLYAYSNVSVKTALDSLRGEQLRYSLNTKKGVMYNGKTAIEKGYISGKEIWLVKENVFYAHRCKYTTCEDSIPHYYFWTNRMKILVGNTAIAEPVVMFVEGIPVIASPFWLFPISKERRSGFLPFKAGRSSYEGMYAKAISYYWVINDYADITFSVDIMEKKGIKPHIEGLYIVKPYMRGNFHGSYIKEWDSGEERWSLNYNHSSVFFYNSRLNWHIDYQTDSRYQSDYAEDEIIWLKKEIRSTISLSKNFKVFNISITGMFRRDFEKQEEEYLLPSFSFSFIPINLFKVLSISNGFYFTNRLKKDTFSVDTTRVLRYSNGINFSSKLLNIFSFNHSTSFSQNINFVGNNSNSYSHSTAISFSMFRVFSPDVFGIRGILHKLTPSISYAISPYSNTSSFFNPPNYDSLISHSISLSLDQFFQGKFGEKKLKKDILLWETSISYSFIEEKFSPIFVNFRVTQIPRMKINLSLTYDLYTDEIKYTISTSTNLGNLPFLWFAGDSTKKRYSLNLNYSQISEGDRVLKFNSKFNITKNWSLAGGGTYNVDTKELISYNFTLKRNFHCWEGIITFNALGEERKFDMELRIKEIPEISLSKKTFGFILE